MAHGDLTDAEIAEDEDLLGLMHAVVVHLEDRIRREHFGDN